MKNVLKSFVSLSLILGQVTAVSINASAQMRPISSTSGIGFGDETESLIRELEYRQSDLRRSEDRLRSDADMARREADRAGSKSRDDQNVARLAQNDVERLRQSVEALQRQAAQANQSVAGLRQQITNAQNTISQSRQQLSSIESQQTQNEAEISRLQAQLAQAQVPAKKAERDRLMGEKSSLQALIADHQKSLDSMPAECGNTECVARKIAYQNAIRENTGKVATIDARLVQLNAEIAQSADAETQLARRQQLKQQLVEQASSAQKAIVSAEAQLRDAQGRLSSEEQNARNLQAQADAAGADLRVKQERAQQAQRIAQESQAFARQTQERSRQASDRLSQVQREISDISREISDLRSRPRVERTVLVGNALGGTTQSELSRTSVRLINIEQTSFNLSNERTVYIMADTLRFGISQQLSDSMMKALEAGVLITVVGDFDRLGATGALKQFIGAETGSTKSTYDVRGEGLLRRLEGISGSQTVLSYEVIRQSSSGETILTGSFGTVIGLSQVMGSFNRTGRLNLVALSVETTGLRILGNMEKTMCDNMSSSESREREICRR